MRLPVELRRSYLVEDRIDSISELMRRSDELNITDSDVRAELDVTAAAFAAADMQESDAIESLPETGDANHQQTAQSIKDFVAYARTVNAAPEQAQTPETTTTPAQTYRLFPDDASFSFDTLIAARRTQQNDFTSDAIKKGALKRGLQTQTEGADLATSLKSQLAVKFVQLLGKVKTAAGYARTQRYTQRRDAAPTAQPASVILDIESDRLLQKLETARTNAFKRHVTDYAKKIHSALASANVSALTPLDTSQRQYVIVLVPSKTPYIALAEVLVMYRLSSRRHAPVASTDALSSLSYLGLRVYGRSGLKGFTSAACTSLGSGTFAHIPPMNVIVSLTSYAIKREDVVERDGSRHTYLTPDKAALALFNAASSRQKEIIKALKAAKGALRGKKDEQTESSDEDESDTDISDDDD
ncbi:hypothetical protein EXIGLDRAFT_707150 [Exidia glandulosa HHB12029]|uniref:Uncharacterized protein n=1 Tax=Exidia glandulosa HHB12029 TaxID=1314781 RepID=A0A165ATV5_EXIGL|nr:hypothetical protein EXIGLDRAFT_707150 [Exidia glandulosa HHB12029]